MSASPPGPDREVREAFLEQARDHSRYLAVEADGARFLVSTRDKHMGRHLFLKQARPEFRVLYRAVMLIEALVGEGALAGRLFVDIGANIGTSTVSALVSHRFGSAVACEPEEENYRLLRANVVLNELEERVTAMRVGVSDRAGHSNLVVSGGPAGKSRVVLDRRRVLDRLESRVGRRLEDPDIDPPEITVTDLELVTLDGLAQSGIIELEHLGMLWIDAEGHEGHILHGAGSLADTGVPVVFEFHPTGLEAEGTRGIVNEIAGQCYTHFVDVRRQEADEERFRLRPVTELARFAEHFLDPSNTASYSDVLLLRLDATQARRGDDLPQLIVKQRVQGRSTTAPSAPSARGRLVGSIVESKALAYGLYERTHEVLERIREAKDQVAVDAQAIAFVHIPSAAGGTITSVLAGAYRAKTAMLDAGNYLKDPEGATTKLSSPRAERARVAAGHVPYALFRQHLPPGTHYATLLREPVDRVLSHYYSRIHRTGTALDERRPVTTDSIGEALEMRLFEITNLATRFLSADPSPARELPATALDEAKANLQEFAFVGIQERLEQSVVLLQRTFGLVLIPYEDRQSSFDSERPSVEEISVEERALITEANHLDVQLYSFALEIFEEAVAASDEEFATDLETLRGRNAALNSEALDAACEWLDHTLPRGGSSRFTELRSAAREAGISVNALRRAPEPLAVSRRRDEEGEWIWTRSLG